MQEFETLDLHCKQLKQMGCDFSDDNYKHLQFVPSIVDILQAHPSQDTS